MIYLHKNTEDLTYIGYGIIYRNISSNAITSFPAEIAKKHTMPTQACCLNKPEEHIIKRKINT